MSDQAHTSAPQPGQPVLRPHVFDGIQEFDQKLPNWWLFTLYIMIVFTFIYWVSLYQFKVLPEDGKSVDARVSAMRSMNPSKLALLSSSDVDVQLWKWSQDPAHVAKGKETFEQICHTCHAKDLSSKLNGIQLPGLPLNDAEWKYGGRPQDILKVVSKGSPDITKGMVAWEPQLGMTKVMDAVAYVLSHHQPPKGLLDGSAPAAGAPTAPAPAAPAAAPAPAPAAPAPTAPPVHDPAESEFLKK